ncbi:hypothetical protein L3A44_10340, partial [Streptococcus pneumoniae]|nr:hypothetical protein [Streptococcus pneumoniae]MDV8407339.1 hypothetical protein [Streptococcus pneumoniae]
KRNHPGSKLRQGFWMVFRLGVNNWGENKAIPRLVREIIGLDRESANRIFSKFLSDENLNARQISFVKLIVDYIVENGFLETKVLTQEPFKSYGSVQLLFQHQLPVLRNIVQIIELINNRAGEAA